MCFNQSGTDAAAVTAQLIFHYGGDADTDANDANANADKFDDTDANNADAAYKADGNINANKDDKLSEDNPR